MRVSKAATAGYGPARAPVGSCEPFSAPRRAAIR